MLRSPDFEKQFILQTDASDRGVGAVLSQLDDKGMDHPVAYYSRKLIVAQGREILNNRERMFGSETWSGGFSGVPVGSAIHSGDRSQSIGVAGQTKGE